MCQNKILDVDRWSNASKILKRREKRLKKCAICVDTGIPAPHGSKSSFFKHESVLNDLSKDVSKKQGTND